MTCLLRRANNPPGKQVVRPSRNPQILDSIREDRAKQDGRFSKENKQSNCRQKCEQQIIYAQAECVKAGACDKAGKRADARSEARRNFKASNQ